VVAQSVLFAVVVATGIAGPNWPRSAPTALTATGWIIGAVGIALVVAGIVALGSSLSPYPKPSDGSTFRQGGAYRLVRHPIYGGFVLLAAGWSLVTSPLALVPTALLWATFELKSRVEEGLLVKRYPGYEPYRERVRWRLVPWVH
jgi:protein-S-isoprenylcysteine O-methyltransferase Ste14